MGMVATSSSWHTPASVRLLPDDGNRYECVAGELLVTPSPRAVHQAVLAYLYEALLPIRRVPGLQMLWSPADLELRADALVQPDLFVFRTAHGGAARSWDEIRTLELAIEVLSPATARYDRVVKRRLFQDVGVAEYWIVDADARVVERWRPADARPEICASTLEWTPRGASEPIVLDLEAIFRAALNE
jgi:Uma2 family endonuclease